MYYYVYILYSRKTNKYYTGITNNINRRLKEHNQRLSNTLTTKYRTDNELIFCQITDTRKEGRKLEKYLKSGSGREIRNQLVQHLGL